MTTQNKKPTHRLVTASKTNGKTYKTEIGAAWRNEDGGFTIRFNALPIGDTAYLNVITEKTEAAHSEAEVF